LVGAQGADGYGIYIADASTSTVTFRAFSFQAVPAGNNVYNITVNYHSDHNYQFTLYTTNFATSVIFTQVTAKPVAAPVPRT